MDVDEMDGSDVFSSYQPMGMDSRRRSIASMSAVGGPLAVVPPLRSMTPSPRYPPSLRSDRLCMRLRSNSGLTFHTNGAVLDQYINYQNNGGPPRPPSATSGALLEEDAPGGVDLLTETYLEGSRGDGFGSADIDLQTCLPFLDFLGLGAFQMSLDNPAISRQLLRYCEEHGCPEHVEFLLKVQEYNQATDEIASVLTGIATSFTSPAAKNPLSLPPMLSRQLNVDIKRMAHTLLPGMESVFIDATRHVKKRIARDAFPGFVQTQFTHCASVALSSGTHGIGSPKLEYPGLGESFCISTVSNQSSPAVLTAASDAFATLTGYPLSEIISSRGCDFMHGSFTDQTTVTRIRAALREGREVSELILNYRRDGEPFWNLFTLFPLKDQQGRLWYWLGAQIDVSESVTSRRDLLRVLNRGRSPDAPGAAEEVNSAVGSTASSETDARGGAEKESDNLSRDGSLRSNSRSGGFLHQFRRGTRSPSPPPTPTAVAEKNSYQYNHNNNSKSSGGPVPRGTRLFAQEYLPRPRAPTVLPVCAHYLVLACEQFVPAVSPNNNNNMMIPQRLPTPGLGGTPKKKQQSLKLNVAFYSEAAAELLCIRGDVTRTGIFQVLEDHANSPSITRSFKSMVRERIEFGKPVSAEILVDRGRNPLLFFGGRKPNHHNNQHNQQQQNQYQQPQQQPQPQHQHQQQQQQQHHYHFHHRLMGGGGSGGSGNGNGGGGGGSAGSSNNSSSRPGSSADVNDHFRSTSGDKLERKMMMMAARAGSTSKQEKLMSHWTPLKNANGDVEWVILVLAPRTTA